MKTAYTLFVVIIALLAALGLSSLSTYKQTKYVPVQMIITGRHTCLSHRDKTGPQTLECAFGFHSDDGQDYALDLNGAESTDTLTVIDSGDHVRIKGIFTPVEMLSADKWQKYDMVGIFSVTQAQKI